MQYVLGPSISAKLNENDGFTVRTAEDARRMVVFFGRPSALKDGATDYGGTGFLVRYVEEGEAYGYLVTAAHVARQVTPEKDIESDLYVRVNNLNGGSTPLQIDKIGWFYHPDKHVDVAATPAYIDTKIFDVKYYELNDLVRPESGPFRVQCGDSIAITGLFSLHAGQKRNTPIVHSGTIALLPDPNEKIPIWDESLKELLNMEAYLVEVQTLKGCSGAPVYQREYVSLSQFPKHNGGHPILTTGAQLLGVYSGAWEGEPDETLAKARGLSPIQRVPVGMGIVVPGQRILEVVVDHPESKKHRAEALRRRREHRAAVTDSGFSDPLATDENPKHREDFTSLLSAAMKKPAPKD